MEDWVTIRTLKSKNPQMSNREIGRLLGGISHNTVKKALKQETPQVYKREPSDNPLIVPFKEYIEECRDKDYQGSRILEEIQSKGYTGSKSAFYRHLSKLEKSRECTAKIQKSRKYSKRKKCPQDFWRGVKFLLGEA